MSTLRKICPRRNFLLPVLCVLLMLSYPGAAWADIGPKPSVQICFTGMDPDVLCYGTLLSERDSTGPASVWNGDEEFALYPEGEFKIWKAFVDYEDEDSFFFLQEFWNCSESGQLAWTYYPPSTFKVLLYYPESGTFCVSPIYETYAFDSYYTVNLTGLPGQAASSGTNAVLTAVESYNYIPELRSLTVRIVLTILLELLIALLFGYHEMSVLAFLAVVNLVTQIGLNVALNVINYHSGPMAFTFYYALMEAGVFILEAVLYANLLHRFSVQPKPESANRAVGYAFTANAASFAAGLWLAHVIPGIF